MRLVILDVEMPERDGIEAARLIRDFERERHKRAVTIVGMTGHEGSDVREHCLEAGMNQVMVKPIKLQTVTDLLSRL